MYKIVARPSKEGDLHGIVQEIKCDHTTKWNMHKPKSELAMEMQSYLELWLVYFLFG